MIQLHDIVLISPMPVPGQEPVLDAYDPADYVNVSTALAYLGAEVRNAGFSVKIFDSTLELFPIYSWERFTDEVSKLESRVFGINVHATCVYSQCLRIAEFLKDASPNSTIILGGLPITYLYEWAFKDSDNFDYIVLGEGERTLVELMEFIKKRRRNLNEIKGIVFKKGNKIVRTQNRPLIAPLDKLCPPAWDLFDLDRIKKLCRAGLGLSSSRGCVGNCAFCSDKNFWCNKIRYHTPARFVSDIKMIIDLGINKFQLTDDDFALNRSFVLDACKRIVENGLEIEWFANCRADSIDEEIISWMKKAGCKRILIGIESGSKKILKTVKKGESPEKIRDSIDIINKYGIESIGTCIVGLPGENYETFAETIKFVTSLNLTSLCFYPFIPFPGCDVWDNPERFGSKIENYCFEKYIEPYVIVSTEELASHEIRTLLFFARYYALQVTTKLDKYKNRSQISDIKRKYLLDRRDIKRRGAEHEED